MDHGVEIDGLDEKASLAGVGQHLLAQIGSLQRSLLDVFEMQSGGGVFGKVGSSQGGVTKNDREHVVKVVRNPARQKAEAFELLCVEHLSFDRETFLFGLLSAGDIARDADDLKRFTSGSPELSADFQHDTAAVRRENGELLRGWFLARDDLGPPFEEALAIVGGEQTLEVGGQRVCLRQAKNLASSIVERGEMPMRAERTDQVARVLEESRYFSFKVASARKDKRSHTRTTMIALPSAASTRRTAHHGGWASNTTSSTERSSKAKLCGTRFSSGSTRQTPVNCKRLPGRSEARFGREWRVSGWASKTMPSRWSSKKCGEVLRGTMTINSASSFTSWLSHRPCAVSLTVVLSGVTGSASLTCVIWAWRKRGE